MESEDAYKQTMLQKAMQLRDTVTVCYLANDPTLMTCSDSDIEVLEWLIKQAEENIAWGE